MNDNTNLPHKDASESTPTTSKKVLGGLLQSANKASEIAGETARKSMEVGSAIARSATQASQSAVGKVQRKLGEDYYVILQENPLVNDTLSRSDLLV